MMGPSPECTSRPMPVKGVSIGMTAVRRSSTKAGGFANETMSNDHFEMKPYLVLLFPFRRVPFIFTFLPKYIPHRSLRVGDCFVVSFDGNSLLYLRIAYGLV